MSFGGLANCPLCWDAPEICRCPKSKVDAWLKESEKHCIREEKTRKIFKEHRDRVAMYMAEIANGILTRGFKHDYSKLSSQELPYYTAMIDEFEKHTFGTEGYHKAKESISEAIKHHYEYNRHHPEHFKDGINEMNLVDLMEMLCDWKSATLNHPDRPGDILKSLDMAVEKYKISTQLAHVLYNTIIDWKLK